jgi:hypothetical protein
MNENSSKINSPNINLNNIDVFIEEINEIKTEGNNYYLKKQYDEAEKKYSLAINKMNSYKISKEFIEKNDKKNLEIIELLKNLYSNLSLSQGKQFKLTEAIKNSNYIISNIDSFHIKSYIRILNWLVSLNQLDAANQLVSEIKIKFFGKNLEKFSEIFSYINLKNEELKEKNNEMLIEKEKNDKNYIKYFFFGIIGIFSTIGITYFYKKKYNKI